jgi:hypothetical protein
MHEPTKVYNPEIKDIPAAKISNSLRCLPVTMCRICPI